MTQSSTRTTRPLDLALMKAIFDRAASAGKAEAGPSASE
jgi:hypothetical protein